MSNIKTFLRVDPLAGGSAVLEPQRQLLASQIPSIVTLYQNRMRAGGTPATSIDRAIVIFAGQAVAATLTEAMLEGLETKHARAFIEETLKTFRQAIENATAYNLALSLADEPAETSDADVRQVGHG